MEESKRRYKCKKLVYIAGKYRSDMEWGIHKNIRLAEDYGAKLIMTNEDFFPVIPHKNTQGYGGLTDDQYMLDGTLELLSACDYILMLPGWTASEGARSEYEYAEKVGIPEITIEEIRKLNRKGK